MSGSTATDSEAPGPPPLGSTSLEESTGLDKAFETSSSNGAHPAKQRQLLQQAPTSLSSSSSVLASSSLASLKDQASQENTCKFVLVVDTKTGKPMDNVMVQVLNIEDKVVEQQYLVSRNEKDQLMLRELPGLVRGSVFTTASVIQHHKNKSNLVFLLTSVLTSLEKKYKFRILSDGAFVDSELVETPTSSIPTLVQRPNADDPQAATSLLALGSKKRRAGEEDDDEDELDGKKKKRK